MTEYTAPSIKAQQENLRSLLSDVFVWIEDVTCCMEPLSDHSIVDGLGLMVRLREVLRDWA